MNRPTLKRVLVAGCRSAIGLYIVALGLNVVLFVEEATTLSQVHLFFHQKWLDYYAAHVVECGVLLVAVWAMTLWVEERFKT